MRPRHPHSLFYHHLACSLIVHTPAHRQYTILVIGVGFSLDTVATEVVGGATSLNLFVLLHILGCEGHSLLAHCELDLGQARSAAGEGVAAGGIVEEALFLVLVFQYP